MNAAKREALTELIGALLALVLQVIIAFFIFYIFKDQFHAPEWGRWMAVLVYWECSSLSYVLYRIKSKVGA